MFFEPPLVYHDIFIELQAPLFQIYYNERALALNGNIRLRDFQFYKIVDAFTAFQEISMYIGNHLARQPEPGDVPDKYRIAQHGFDPDWSFRKKGIQ